MLVLNFWANMLLYYYLDQASSCGTSHLASLMPIVPQSESRVKFSAVNFRETDEKCGEILANFFVDFRP